MQYIWDFFGKMWFRLITNNNWRWVMLALFIAILLIPTVTLFHYALPQPSETTTTGQHEKLTRLAT